MLASKAGIIKEDYTREVPVLGAFCMVSCFSENSSHSKSQTIVE